MSIRKKIFYYFSVVTIAVVGVAFISIYALFYQYRSDDFHELQREKITSTLRILSEIRHIDEEVLQAMDQININALYDEKLLIFNKDHKLIYASIDDTPTPKAQEILNELSPEESFTAQMEGGYDVVGVYIQFDGSEYYGISKAYDVSGNHKLNYLKFVLWLAFFTISIVVVMMATYLSRRITQPIAALTKQINDFDIDRAPELIAIDKSENEVAVLAQRFNDLMKRMNAAFLFQRHAIQHISHELKTPIAVLISNIERIEQETDLQKIREFLKNQKEDTESLSSIINSLLEISKSESGINLSLSKVRVDELIFDLVEELNVLHPEFQFTVDYTEPIEEETTLTICANPRLIKAAITNLMVNCIQYSDNQKARILIKPLEAQLQLQFINSGDILTDEEKPFIFQHFFRGENSKGKRGFGLGLVFIHKILTMHHGTISYSSNAARQNIFSVTIPLS